MSGVTAAALVLGLAWADVRHGGRMLPAEHAVPPPPRATDIPPERQREILRDAMQVFDQAVALGGSDPARAEALYREAAVGFESLIASGLRNAALEYNLGNTFFRLGEPGRAILHYRRAQRMDPNDEKLAANLSYARRQVDPYIPPSGSHRLLQQLLFWHYGTSLVQRFWVAAVLSAVGWLLLAVRLRRPARAPSAGTGQPARKESEPLTPVRGMELPTGLGDSAGPAAADRHARALTAGGVVLVILALCAAGSVAWEIREETLYPSAVIVGEQYVLRLGRGEGADIALKQPLGPGVELRILQQRADWVEVRLPNGQTGWLPAVAVELM